MTYTRTTWASKVSPGDAITISGHDTNDNELLNNINQLDSVTRKTADLIGTSDLASGAVTAEKISDGAVSTAKLLDSAVTSAKIADNTIQGSKLADNSVTNAKIVSVDGSKIPGTISAITRLYPTSSTTSIDFANEIYLDYNNFTSLFDGLGLFSSETVYSTPIYFNPDTFSAGVTYPIDVYVKGRSYFVNNDTSYSTQYSQAAYVRFAANPASTASVNDISSTIDKYWKSSSFVSTNPLQVTFKYLDFPILQRLLFRSGPDVGYQDMVGGWAKIRIYITKDTNNLFSIQVDAPYGHSYGSGSSASIATYLKDSTSFYYPYKGLQGNYTTESSFTAKQFGGQYMLGLAGYNSSSSPHVNFIYYPIPTFSNSNRAS